MLKRITALLLTLSLLLTACAQNKSASSSTGASQEDDTFTVACTTFPVYLLAQAVADGVDGTEIALVIDQQISCLHDYTLTMQDMGIIEASDLLAINGAGLENFLSDVLASRTYLDCSEGIALSESEEGGDDPHIWLSPVNAGAMAQNLAKGMAEADPDHAKAYQANADAAQKTLETLETEQAARLANLKCSELITFHDGFHYFASAVGLTIAAAVEEEEGSEVSAQRVTELAALVQQNHIPALFTELNGSTDSADALGRECNVPVYALNLGMSRDSIDGSLTGLADYESIFVGNVDTVLEAYQ